MAQNNISEDPRIQNALKDPRFLALNPEEQKKTLSAMLQKIDTEKIPQTPSEVSNSIVAKDAPIRKVQIDPVSIASGAAGALAGGASASVPGLNAFSSIIGSGTMAATDKLLRGLTGEYQPENATQVITDVAKDALVNELVGKAADFVLARGTAAYDAITNPKNIKLPSDRFGLRKLKPTGSQVLKAERSGFAGPTSFVEDLFAPTDKYKALQRSFDAAKDEGDLFIEGLTGRKGVSLANSDQFSRLIKSGEEETFLKLKSESTARGEAAKLIAEANKEVIPIFTNKAIGRDATGKPIMGMVKSGEKIVNGPVKPENTILYAKRLLDEAEKPLIGPDPNLPATKALQDILERSNAKFNAKGNLTSYDPISFKDIWETKKISDAIGQGNPMSSQNIKDARFKGLSSAINQDVEASMPAWKNSGDKALNLWNESKQIVAKRESLFNPTDETGKSLPYLLDKETEPRAALNAIFDDTKKTQNFLNTGHVVIPNNANGVTNVTPIKIISNNARKDAQGYTLMRFLNESETASSADTTKRIFDPVKLSNLVNDPNRQENLKQIFGSQGLSNVKQFFNNIMFTSQKGGGNPGASRYLALKFGTGVLGVGSGVANYIASGNLSSSTATGAAVVGASMGMHQLAKLLTNPESARVLIAMARGGPLNMSTQMATRVLANNLRNQPIVLQYADGNSVAGKIDSRGKFVIELGSKNIEGKK